MKFQPGDAVKTLGEVFILGTGKSIPDGSEGIVDTVLTRGMVQVQFEDDLLTLDEDDLVSA